MNPEGKSYRARVIDAITNQDFIPSVMNVSLLPAERVEFNSLLGKMNDKEYLSPDEKKSLSDYLAAEKVLSAAKRVAVQKIEEIFYSI